MFTVFMNLLNAAAGSTIALYFFRRLFKLRANKPLNIAAFTLTVLVNTVRTFTSFIWDNFWLNLITAMLMCFFMISLMFEGSVKDKAKGVLMYMAALLIDTLIMRLIMAAVFRSMGNPMAMQNMPTYVSMILTNSTAIIVLNLFLILMKRERVSLSKHGLVLVVAYPVFSLLMLVAVEYLIANTSMTPMVGIVLLAVGGVLVYFNIIIFELIKQYSNKIELIQMRELLRKNEESYEMLKKNEEEIRKLNHDIKEHIRVTKELVDKGDKQIPKDYINALEKLSKSTATAVYTGDQVLDSVLNIEGRKAKQNGISFVVKTYYMDAPMKTAPTDKSAIMSNLLRNSFEACMRIDGERFIVSDIRTTDEKIRITVLNTAEPVVIEHNSIVTSKSDMKRHGLGLKIMADLVEKYNGKYEIKYSEGVLSVNIVMDNIEI